METIYIKHIERVWLMGLFCLITLILATPNTGYAQSNNRVIKRSYTMDGGLPSNRVYSIVQDSIGFIWMGTNNGLVKFDGKEFTGFRADNQEENTIFSNDIMDLLLSSDHKIWIALENGVDVYDLEYSRFTHFDYKTQEGAEIRGRTVDILEDHDGDIWIATANDGLFRFIPFQEKLINYRNNKNDSTSISQDKISTISEDDLGNIWVGTDNQGISIFSKKTEKFTRYKTSGKKGAISENSIRKITKDSYGNIWVGTLENGIDRFDRKSDSFINFAPDGENNLLYHIQDISEYESGQLMVASDNGVGIFKNEEGSLSFKQKINSNLLPEVNNYIYALFKDGEGGLWLGSYFNGVEYIPPTQNNFNFFGVDTEEGQGSVINAILEGENNQYWIGTDNNGIFQFDLEKNEVTPYKTAEDINSSYYNIHDFLLEDNKLYAATYGRGLEVFDLSTHEMKSYRYDFSDSTSISSSRVFSLFKSAEGKIYVGTSDGVDYFNRKEKIFEHLPIRDRVVKIIEDKENQVWMATRNDGLYRYDPRNEQYVHYKNNPHDNKSIVSNALTTIALDDSGNIWVGSSGYGLCKYDKEKDEFLRYPELGLPNEVISSIIPIGNTLWIATNKGLVKWNFKTQKQELFTKGDGLYSEQFRSGAYNVSHTGNIILGTTDGFSVFSPNKLTENTFNPSVVVTRLFINNELIAPSLKDSPLEKSIELNDPLVLNYDQSNIRIDFASLSFVSPEHNIFKYKLEGYDNSWHNTDYKSQSLTYTNLPRGNYTLKIKGTNNDRVWSDKEVKLKIEVKPHFLVSNLAMLLYGVVVVFCMWVLIRYLLRSSERRHDEKIKLLTAETQKSIYDSKMEFFTNITHEIRTPLSLIMGPLEYIEKSPKINKELKEYLSVAQINAKRLHALIVQLLDFRKVDSGLLTIRESFLNFSDLIEEVGFQFKTEAQKSNIQLTVEVKPEEIFMLSDERALDKIISNLISNALKFADKFVKVEGIEREQNYLISVEDDGPGIPEEERKNIFKAFYQAEQNSNRANGGIGVGLNMTQKLVKLLGGSVQILDRDNNQKGIKFLVTLPKKKENPELFKEVVKKNKKAKINAYIEEDFDEMEEEENENQSQKRKLVLLVDDNQDVIEFLSRVLDKDYAVLTANSGKEGLLALKDNQIDLVVSDVMMGGMDGLEFCKQIKSDLEISHIPIVLLTAKTNLETKLEGLDIGIDAYMEKPFSPSQLKAQLENLLVKREALKLKFAKSTSIDTKVPTNNKLDETFINSCKKIINENIGNSNFSVDLLADELSVSRTIMFRKIKALTGMTPNNFIKMLRLKEARKLLAESAYNINEVGYLMGFNSPSYFSKCFTEQFGVTPSDFIKEQT